MARAEAAANPPTILLAQIPRTDRVKPVLPPRTGSVNAPSRLRCQWMRDPLGVQEPHPRLTWAPPQRDTFRHEAAYQIQVAQSMADLGDGHNLIWDSGKVTENPDLLPQYNGPVFHPYTHYFWRVRVWSRSGWQSQWSRTASWMTGPLKSSEWRGSWISYQHKISNPFYTAPHNAYYGLPLPKKIFHKSWIQKEPCPIFRKVFHVPGNLQHACMYISGLGYWEVRVNGHAVGPGVLYSTMYDYSKAVPYQSFDVSSLLRKGKRNVISIALGNGWYNIMERDTWGFQNAFWRAWPRARMNLLLQTPGGKKQWIVTNNTWQAADGPRLADGVYNGEVYDAALKIRGWNDPDQAMPSLAHAQMVKAPPGRLTSQLMPPCEVVQRLAPVSITEPQSHVFVVKFPENMSGWVTLTAKGKPGVPVVLGYGERLFANGLVNRKPISVYSLTGSFQTDTVIPASNKPFTYHPNFAYNGFQYVQINGLKSKRDIVKIQADFIHTAFHRSGVFWCSNELLDAIVDATNRSYCSNFMGYPTDCPSREKLGWTGDTWLASTQGMMTYDNQAGYAKWLHDFSETQYPSGQLSLIVPNPNDWLNAISPDFESSYEFVTWNEYLYTGDGKVLRQHYNGIKRYFLYTLALYKSTHGKGWVLGDWATCSHTPPPTFFVSSCILYHDAILLQRMAGILGRTADAKVFASDAAEIRTAFNAQYYHGRGIYDNGGQAAEALPLYYGLVPVDVCAAVVRQLVADVHAHRDHLDVGIFGDKCLFRVLSRYGHTALAYRIATQTTYPSYGQWILDGATTLWEGWGTKAVLPTKQQGPASLNHIMFGDILGWMYNDLAGIKPDWRSPGFRTVLIDPHPIRGLSWAGAAHDSRFGKIVSSWRWHNQQLHLIVVIPPATTAVIRLPHGGQSSIQCNGSKLNAQSVGVLSVTRAAKKSDAITVEVAPGRYEFSYVPRGTS
ncbi:MAG: family 78 glycoside hydrolase catalytic domain [Phycisphaerae bacterium]